MPACDSSDAKDSLNQIVANFVGSKADPAKVKAGLKLSDIAEVSYDAAKETRECKVTLELAVDGKTLINKEPLGYTITWSDKGARKYFVQPHPIT